MFLLRQATNRMVVRYDAEIGHAYVPRLNARIPHEGGGYFVRTNALGFRSDVEFVEKRQARPRILFFGDSFTAGDGVDNHQRFSDLVGAALDADAFNYGLSGSGTDQHLLLLRKFAKSVEADAIVLGVMVENIERIQVAYRESIDRISKRRMLVPKPYFTLEEGRLVPHHVPVPRERPFADDVPRDQYQSYFPAGLTALRGYYDRYIKGRPGIDRTVRGAYSRVRKLQMRMAGSQPYKDYASADTPGWKLMEAILSAFAEERGAAPLLIVPIPTSPYLDDVDPAYQPLFERWAQGRPGVRVLDLTAALRALDPDARRRLRFNDDEHLAPFGHARVAEAIAAELKSMGVSRRADGRSVARQPSAARRHEREGLAILGISAFYHDSAAALIKDGQIIAAAQEERFTRVKNDRRYPQAAINYCLEEAGLHPHQLAAVVYYDNAALTFERIVHSALAGGAEFWSNALASWVQHKLHIPQHVRRQLGYAGLFLQDLHHRSHAASAFYASPFEDAAIVTMDGVGEWATASIGVGEGNRIDLIKELHFPSSLGLLYSAFTQFTGFKVNSGEYKMMGLAPYGSPIYTDAILEHLVDLKDDGSLDLNLEYFGFLHEPRMTNEKFARLFGGPQRDPQAPITRREMDLAASCQQVTEEVILRMVRYAHEVTGKQRLCLAGGVALNCVANGRVLREGPFTDLWIQPAAGDAGGAIGCALDVYHTYFGRPRVIRSRPLQRGSFLGPGYSDDEIRGFLETHGYPHRQLKAENRSREVAQHIAEGRVVGHFAGRSEFVPRALGARSILADPRNPETQTNLNLKIKYRESFRPFAPAVLAERVGEYFELDRESPYMMLVAPVRSEHRQPFERGPSDDLLPVVRQVRSHIPAVTHVDYSARIQTVVREDHPEFYDVIRAFADATGCAVVVNTSFNVRGEPIVNTPEDAYRCFMRTEMDVLVLGSFLLLKNEQPAWQGKKGHIEEPDSLVASPAAKGLEAAMLRIYEAQLRPLMERLSDEERLAAPTWRGARSRWVEAEPADLQRIFVVPNEMDQETISPERMTRAIMSVWRPGRVRDLLIPVVEQMLTMVSERRAEAFPEEEVSQNVYVMF